MSRRLIECTYVFEHPSLNTGIQRVVKNIIKYATKKADCIPVVIINNQIFHLKDINKPYEPSIWRKIKNKTENFSIKFWKKKDILFDIANRNFPKYHLIRKLFKLSVLIFMYTSYPIAAFCAFSLRRFLFLLESLSFPTDGILAPLTIKKGDTLILLDSSWHSSFLEYVGSLREKGLKIITVVYDLIPVTHSHLCHDSLASIFENWVHWIVQNSDGFITISQTIQKELENYIVKKKIKRKTMPWFEHFYLGYDLPNRKEEQIEQKIIDMFKNKKNIYLVVGTIEPRKNHSYIIEAFNLLWEDNADVAVCFVGKIGWKHNNIVSAIHSHKKYQDGLYLFSSLNDRSLEFAYQNSKSLIIASFVEGFGLPIVEALEKKLPVMASDIPIFREIGEDYITYFDLSNPNSLAKEIKNFESKNQLQTRDIENWKWISWESSANQFFSKIEEKMKLSEV